MQLNNKMKKFLLFALVIGFVNCATEAKITKVFKGTEAVQSEVNPCQGPTIRTCAEIIIDDIITTGVGDEVNVTIKRYGTDGTVTSVENFTATDYMSPVDEKAKLLENFYVCPPNATLIVE